MVHEVQGGDHVGVGDAPEVNERVLVDVVPEHGSEEVGAGRENQFVSLNLPGPAAQSAVEQIFLTPELSEGGADVLLEVIPLQTELFTRHLESLSVWTFWRLFSQISFPFPSCLSVGVGLKYFHPQLLNNRFGV